METKPRAAWLPRVVVESALIVVSILAALAVDEWRENRQWDERIVLVRQAFVEEIRGNLEVVTDGLPHHERMWNAYREAAGIAAPTLADRGRLDEEFDTGLRPPRFRDTAWRSFSAGEAFSRLPYDEVVTLARIYREQEFVDDLLRTVMQNWYQPRSDSRTPDFIRDDIRATRVFLADLVAAEGRLIDMYTSALEGLAAAP